jgi:hypothetical protein
MAFAMAVGEHLNHLGIIAEVCREIGGHGVAQRAPSPGLTPARTHRRKPL